MSGITEHVHRLNDTLSGNNQSYLSKAVITGVGDDGVYRDIKVNSLGYLMTSELMLEISKGNVEGHAVYRKFGKIGAIQSATPADCWEFGVTVGAEEYTWSTSAIIDSISSSNVNDTQEITIVMLDANYVEFTQTATLNGQTRVPITSGLRLNRAYNSNGTATTGNIYIYEDTPLTGGVPILVTKVRGYFSIAGQQTLQSMYTVPAGKSAYLYELKTSMSGRKTGFATYEAFLRVLGGVFLIKDTHDLSMTGNSLSNDVFTVPRMFPEKTDYKPKITVDTNDIGFTVSFVVVLVDN